jgi:hypothetical protein
MKSRGGTDRKIIAAVGIAGLIGIIVTTMINMGFLVESVTMSDPVFFQSVILVLNAVIVVGITVSTARWIYGKL